MKWLYPIAFFFVFVSTGCGTLKNATTHGLSNGRYTYSDETGKKEVYIAVTEDSLEIYKLKQNKNSPDQPVVVHFNQDHPFVKLSKAGLDFDIATILFKYRFKTGDMPAQMNSNLNVAGYLGYKKEFFRFRSTVTPDGRFKTSSNHYSVDAGLFTGFGSTPLNPSTTNGILSKEYDGFIWQNGVAAFIGFDIFTFGIGLGFDRLLDANRKIWIYNGKPWLGVMVGLTLQN